MEEKPIIITDQELNKIWELYKAYVKWSIKTANTNTGDVSDFLGWLEHNKRNK